MITEGQGGETLILCFSGWASTSQLFCHLHVPEGHEVWVVSDYRDLTFDASLHAFRAVRVVGWSMGVWVASRLFQEGGENILSATAVNGTPIPIDDRLGIPEAVFEGTLAHLSAAAKARFDRRMCDDRPTLDAFLALPQPPLERGRAELRALRDAVRSLAPAEAARIAEGRLWNRAIIGRRDRIFPPQNQQAYWRSRGVMAREIDASHCPFPRLRSWEELWT